MAVSAAQLLDELMGRDRNRAPGEPSFKHHWSDPEVCKYFLCGFCPHELFTNTKADLGTCPKVHDEALKKEYSKSGRTKQMGYEDNFTRYLKGIMNDVDRRIRRGHERLALNAKKEKELRSVRGEDEKMTLISDRIKQLLTEIEALGSEGKVEEAQGMMKLVEQLKDEKETLVQMTKLNPLSSQEKEMEVCQVCGAFLIVGDAQSRVDDHLQGKQHVGYARIKSTLDDIQQSHLTRPPIPVDRLGNGGQVLIMMKKKLMKRNVAGGRKRKRNVTEVGKEVESRPGEDIVTGTLLAVILLAGILLAEILLTGILGRGERGREAEKGRGTEMEEEEAEAETGIEEEGPGIEEIDEEVVVVKEGAVIEIEEEGAEVVKEGVVKEGAVIEIEEEGAEVVKEGAVIEIEEEGAEALKEEEVVIEIEEEVQVERGEEEIVTMKIRRNSSSNNTAEKDESMKGGGEMFKEDDGPTATSSEEADSVLATLSLIIFDRIRIALNYPLDKFVLLQNV
eukprot:gene9142-10115_t